MKSITRMPSMYKCLAAQCQRLARNDYQNFLFNLYLKRYISLAANPLSVSRTTTEPNIKKQKDKCLHYDEKDGYYRTSPFEAIAVPNVTLDKYVWQGIHKWQHKVATVDVITGRQYTYAELRDCCAALAVRLQKQFRLQQGDVLAICMPNTPEYPGAVLGAIEAGLTVTTINPLYTAEEISRQLSFSKAKFLIGTCDAYPVLLEACKLSQKSIPIACLRLKSTDQMPDGAVDFNELFTPGAAFDYSQLKQYDIKPDDLVFLPFSSGTTGLPKGVMLPHKCITMNSEQIQTVLPIDSTEQEVVPAILPFFHIYGLTVVMMARLSLGCKLVTMPQFKPDDFIKCFTDYKATIMNLVPPLILFMINSAKLTTEMASSMHTVFSGAAPLGLTDVERFLKKFPQAKFLQGFGMTETSPVLILTPYGNTRYASTGFPVSNTEAKIVSIDNGETKGLPANQSGELCVRGPQIMSGYLNNETATKESFYEGCWLRTGDVAHYDDDGYFYITDRMKELIKVKAFQVPPAELEAILRHHPKIMDAAVFGIPHASNGEAPKALVVLKPKAEATEEEIYNYVSDRVAHYKRLDGGVKFVDEIPKNPTGKILRRVLREKYAS